MKGTKLFDVTSSEQLTRLINDMYNYYDVLDIAYSTYVFNKVIIHYTALVTYTLKIEDDW